LAIGGCERKEGERGRGRGRGREWLRIGGCERKEGERGRGRGREWLTFEEMLGLMKVGSGRCEVGQER